jgi:hypothetical protein
LLPITARSAVRISSSAHRIFISSNRSSRLGEISSGSAKQPPCGPVRFAPDYVLVGGRPAHESRRCRIRCARRPCCDLPGSDRRRAERAGGEGQEAGAGGDQRLPEAARTAGRAADPAAGDADRRDQDGPHPDHAAGAARHRPGPPGCSRYRSRPPPCRATSCRGCSRGRSSRRR